MRSLTMEPPVRLSYQATENALRLTLDRPSGEAVRRVTLPGYVDVGEGGRLVGVEATATAGIDLATALAPWRVDPVAADFVSLEDDAAYIELSAPEEASLRESVRTAPARLTADIDGDGRLVALSIPRRGHGFEISYPSGNR
jgi:hypothetical protein